MRPLLYSSNSKELYMNTQDSSKSKQRFIIEANKMDREIITSNDLQVQWHIYQFQSSREVEKKMPLLIHKPKKHTINAKLQAKMPMMMAHKTQGGVAELIVREIEKSSGLQTIMDSVNLRSSLERSDPISEFKTCSFFDIPEDIKDYQQKYGQNCEELMTMDTF